MYHTINMCIYYTFNKCYYMYKSHSLILNYNNNLNTIIIIKVIVISNMYNMNVHKINFIMEITKIIFKLF